MQYFTLTFPGHICIYTSHSSHPPWWNFPIIIRFTAYIMKFSLRHFLYPPASISPNDGKNIFLRTSFSKYFQSVVFSQNERLGFTLIQHNLFSNDKQTGNLEWASLIQNYKSFYLTTWSRSSCGHTPWPIRYKEERRIWRNFKTDRKLYSSTLLPRACGFRTVEKEVKYKIQQLKIQNKNSSCKIQFSGTK